MNFRCLPTQTTLGFHDLQIREITGMDKNVRTAELCIFSVRGSQEPWKVSLGKKSKCRQKGELPGPGQSLVVQEFREKGHMVSREDSRAF